MDVSEGNPTTFATDDGLTLEGVLHLPPLPGVQAFSLIFPGIVVCHPHPQYGGDMRNNVVATLCEVAVACGLAALRFNFRGVGASEGAFDNGIGEQRDVVAALEYLRRLPDVDPERIGLAGYSFGATVALRALSLSGGPALSLTYPLAALICVSTPTIGGALPQTEVAYPLLLVSGDRDEYSDPHALSRFAEIAGPSAELVILPGVDHFWWGSDERLAEAVSAFLMRTLSSAHEQA